MDLIQLHPPANGHDCMLALTWHELGRIIAAAKLVAEEHPGLDRGFAAALDRLLWPAQHSARSTQHAARSAPPLVLTGPGGDYQRGWPGATYLSPREIAAAPARERLDVLV